MRKKPLKICARAGCFKKTIGRFCNIHKKYFWYDHDQKRPNSNQRGYDYQWYKFRSSYLEKNPLCLFCKEFGLLTSASEIDHKKSLSEYPELKYCEENLRPLCKRCHSKRTWNDQSIGAKNAEKEKSHHT